MHRPVRGFAVSFVVGFFLFGLSPLAALADVHADTKLIERGKQISLTVAGIGCAGCHGLYGEGDVGIGPYTRGVDLSKIQAAIGAIDQMRALLKDKLSSQDIEAVAAYYSWLGQLQLVKTLVKRDRFIPDTVDIYPGTTVQLAIKNSSQFPRKFAGPDMNVSEFQVPGTSSHDFVWRAPDAEGTHTLRCVDCLVPGQQLTINVRRSAKQYHAPERQPSTRVAKAAPPQQPLSGGRVADKQVIEYGRELFLHAGEVGCTACHGPYAEGDIGIGPYNRGFSERAIRDALKTVDAMTFLRAKLTDQQISQVAAYYKWLGGLQLVKTQLVNGRFFPDSLAVRPGTRIQLAIANRNNASVEVAGEERMEIPVMRIAAHDYADNEWTAPDTEGSFTVRCMNCALTEGQFTIKVTKTARAYTPPVQIK